MGTHTHDGFLFVAFGNCGEIFASIWGPNNNNLPGLVDKSLKSYAGCLTQEKLRTHERSTIYMGIFQTWNPKKKSSPFFVGGKRDITESPPFIGERCLRKHQHQKWLQWWVDFSWKPGCSCSMKNLFRWLFYAWHQTYMLVLRRWSS